MNTHRAKKIKGNLIKGELLSNEKALGIGTISPNNASLLSNISHEIRTPVNVIVGFTNLLIDPTYDDEQKQFFIQEINHNSKELLRVVDKLIYSAKINCEEYVPEMFMYPINDILSEMRSEVDHLIQNIKYKKFKIIFKKTSIPDDSSIFTDKKKLITALLYLIENTQKLSVNGPIEWGAEMLDNSVKFFVQDGGSKINQKYLVKVINDFQNEKITNSEDNQAKGIGLTIAEKLIRTIGGKLTIKSTFNKGSSFFFTIPLLVEKPV